MSDRISRRTMRIEPRYCVRFPAGVSQYNEADCRHGRLRWKIEVHRIALVCLDIWNTDVHRDMTARDDAVTRRRIAPVLRACRRRGILVIHAPAPPIARRHPNYVALVGRDEKAQPEYADSPDWPPAAFRRREGKYGAYAEPGQARKLKAWKLLDDADFHPLVRPEGDEPVVATGEELHRLCARRGILFLLYAGFHTPGCMTGRSYGILKMQARGYACILLRDCTNGMETAATFRGKVSMKGTIAFLEQTGIPTLTSSELVHACRSA